MIDIYLLEIKITIIFKAEIQLYLKVLNILTEEIIRYFMIFLLLPKHEL